MLLKRDQQAQTHVLEAERLEPAGEKAICMTDKDKRAIDGFCLLPSDPHFSGHLLINGFLTEAFQTIGSWEEWNWFGYNPEKSKTWKSMVELSLSSRGAILEALIERLRQIQVKIEASQEKAIKEGVLLSRDREFNRQAALRMFLLELFGTLFQPEVSLGTESRLILIRLCADTEITDLQFPYSEALITAEALANGSDFGQAREVIGRLVQKMRKERSIAKFYKKPLERLDRLLAEQPSRKGKKGRRLPLQSGEAWSDAATAEIGSLSPDKQEGWYQLLLHCLTAKNAAPSAAWLRSGNALVDSIGTDCFSDAVARWFGLVDSPRTQRIESQREYEPDLNELIIEPHMDILRGLSWCCSFREDKDLARALSGLARSAYRKISKLGPRAVRVGNAAVTALGMMPGIEGVYHLALLKVKVKFGTAQKVIEKAFNTAAEKAGLLREQIEELAVPSYGMTEVGVLEDELGEFKARLRVTGTTSTELVFVNADGKVQRSVPAALKGSLAPGSQGAKAARRDAEQGTRDARATQKLKELQAAAKDIQRMLPAQRERLDTLFLQQKSWPYAVWRERYLDHPLVGVLARRLLWDFKRGDESLPGIWFDGKVVDLDLREVRVAEGTWVELWHPIGRDVDEVVGWRSWLEAQGVQQPFKQAHREVYVLTEAERRTDTYSNRYAAHILKQHQFSALCALRGWKNKLRLMVDDEYPPATLHLRNWGLRAEFWIEGMGSDYGTDTNESGVFLYVATDQVRFYRTATAQRTAHAGGGGYHPTMRAEEGENVAPLRLEAIPALVFSEVMRDVDMFVGVANVGNDPTWSDGGPNGRYVQYWNDFSFGELNGSAKTRKQVLERLIPRLKIAGQCSFSERFLVVKGKLRTYKIHLGSGNILMSPNDQYLCIVPKQGLAEDGKVLLPFEGDRTLSLVISKAFLLAEDEKIRDETILRQIVG